MNPICTPLDTGVGHLWCQTTVTVGDAGLTWQQMVLTYAVVLLVTLDPVGVGSEKRCMMCPACVTVLVSE